LHGRLICSEHSAPAAALSALDELITASAAAAAPLIARLVTILGIGQRTAEVIVAKAGGVAFSGATRK
jgi:3-methyladenine DNA glycosylase/8-oxoguanine DNA glycosylase